MAAAAARPATLRTRGVASKTAGRKGGVINPVDTSLFSYDRTDPFTALNVLRKLLSALPSRIGGCQYKLTPEEHKLSLHLLTIVEPFVGLSPSPGRSLTRQPTEIVDAIVSHVDAKRDLLNLALSCRRLHTIVFPRHYDYRVVKCKVSALSVWNHLIVNRALAQNVRRLEIMDERAPDSEAMIPTDILTTDTDLESTDDELGMHVKQERYLVSALSRMTSLRSFIWSCNHSPICIDDVWPTLLKCQSLQQVEIRDNLVFQAAPEATESGVSSRKKRQAILPDLKTVGLHATKHTYGTSKNPELGRISSMLNNCPNLETLEIGYTSRRAQGFFNPVADDFLLFGRWPSLRSLTLTNLWCSPHAGFDAAASFLAAHVNLEVLHLDVTFGADATTHKFPPHCLPRLRELKAGREIATALLACPGARPLETLKGVRLSGSAWDGVFYAQLKTLGRQMRRVELAGWNEMEDVRRLVECVPHLTWLDLGKRGGAAAQTTQAPGASAATSKAAVPVIAGNFTEWAMVLAQLPDLATFHGVRFFHPVTTTDQSMLSLSDRSRVRKNDEVASVLAWKCAKLRRLDHWEEGSGKIIVLLRDSDKVRYEVRRVKT